MSILKKYIPWLISVMAAFIIFILIRTVLSFFEPFATPNQNIEDMKEDFSLNQKYIFMVRDFLISSEFEEISILERHVIEHQEMFTGLETGRVPIDDAEILEALRTLFDNGYRSMSKGDNLVAFLRWTGLDTGIGLVYSICGRTPTVPSNTNILQFLVHIELFIIENWYFYIEDFNVWRSRYRN